MEAYTWPDGETGHTNGTINLSYSPETPGAILIELTSSFNPDEAQQEINNRGCATLGEVTMEELQDIINLDNEN